MKAIPKIVAAGELPSVFIAYYKLGSESLIVPSTIGQGFHQLTEDLYAATLLANGVLQLPLETGYAISCTESSPDGRTILLNLVNSTAMAYVPSQTELSWRDVWMHQVASRDSLLYETPLSIVDQGKTGTDRLT